MKLDDFKKIVLMCKEYTNCLYLHIKGEPLMHPNFIEILDYLETINMNVKITTNGEFLKQYQKEILRYSNILRINISLQSLITKNLEDVCTYLESLVVFLNEITKIGKTNVSLRLWNDKNNDKTTEYNYFIKKYFKECYNCDFIDSQALIPHVYCSIEDEFMWPSDSIVDNLERSKCLGGTTHIGILANGEVVLCCLDNIGATTFGNVKNQTLHDIIENSNFNRIVGNLKNGKCDYEICQKCTYRNRFK